MPHRPTYQQIRNIANMQYIVALPSRRWTAKASVFIMLIISISFMIMSQNGNSFASRLRMTIIDTLTPVVSIVSKPIEAVANASTWISEIIQLRADNIALQNSNIQLLQWQTTAKELQAENANLRELLNVIPSKKSNYITARMVTDMSGPFVRSALIGAGSNDGIKKNQAVINEKGLIGRVVEVGDSNSRILLLNDINSRVPVIAETSREKTILVGNNDDLPTLSYISPNTNIKIGERIITSGDGGVFPRGVAVGVVTSIESNIIKVQPLVDFSGVDFVSIVDYSL